MVVGAMVESVAALRFRSKGSGISWAGGSQARKNFITENTENHRDPRRKARIALRAKRIIVRLGQGRVGVFRTWRWASFLRGSQWFSVFSVIKPCLFLAPDNGPATCTGGPRA
jgi:hypothetical protein